jgi:outer membrane receptor protein involved in Fe transport
MKPQSNFLRLLAGVSALTISTAAFAQADQPSTTTTAPTSDAAAAAPAAAPAPAAEIVVTGSRVIKNGSASPTPLTTISTQALAVASPAGTISDALNNLPVFSGSRNSYSNPGSNATGVQGGNGNANVLNLRNLGTYRTLVLFDGHRIPPTLFNSTVDVDLIPQELIDRVDVVTGGVSAVYGSDAISGVVNYILNSKFDGFRAHVEGGVSQRGDAGNQDIGGAFGTKLGDRGHFEASVQHREYDGILDRAYDRNWDNLAAIIGGGDPTKPVGSADNPYMLATNVRLSTYSFGGYIPKGALAGQTFNQNGVLSTFNKGTATGSSCCQIGGDGAYQDASMASPSKSTQAFGRFDYDLTDDLHFYVQGALNLKKSVSYTGWNQLAGVTLGATNAYLDPAYQAELAAAGQSTFTLNEILKQAPRIQNISKTTQWYVNTGIDGHLGGFKWEATYTHGASRMKTQVNNQVNQQRLTAAADAVKDSNGNIVCEAALTDPSVYGGCSPIDLFGPSAASAQALDYVLGSTGFVTHTIQDSADASISGSLFDTWAGPVNVALSGEWRRQTFDAKSFGQSSAYVDCTGLRYCSTATLTPVYASTFPDSPTVAQSVKEAAIEVDVPLLKDKPFVKSFDVNGAARYTDYSTSGHYATWKVGAVWAVNDDLKLRGTISRDIRAPTLYDLFQPTTTVYGNFTDVSKGVTAYLPSVNIGNPNLTSEVGHTYTLGAVLKPHFVPGLTLTVDYYHTLVTNAISVIQGFNAAVQQGCIQSGGASVYCSLIQRDAAGNATAYYIQPENIARVKTYGWDGEADYSTRIGEHPLNLRLLVNYQPHIYYQQPGIPTIDQGDAGWGLNGLMPSPSVQLAGFVDFKPTDNFTIDLFEHWRNKFRRSGVASQVFADPYVKSYATTNLTLTLDTGSAWVIKDSQFYLSVTNLFDAKPPLSGYYSGSTSAGQSYEFSDDPTGRALLVGFRIKG